MFRDDLGGGGDFDPDYFNKLEELAMKKRCKIIGLSLAVPSALYIAPRILGYEVENQQLESILDFASFSFGVILSPYYFFEAYKKSKYG